MKKNLNLTAAVLMLFSVLFFYSCSNDENVSSVESTENEVLFEDNTIKNDISPNFTDNHYYLIEKLGKNSERSTISKVIQSEGVNLSALDLQDVKKFYSNNTTVIMYSVPFKDASQKAIVYKYKDVYQVSIADLYDVGNKMQQFELKTLDNQPVYSLRINDSNKIGDFKFNDNAQMDAFSNEVNGIHLKQRALNNSLKPNPEEGFCCRNESEWRDCVECLVSTCQANFICEMFYGWFQIEMYIGFSLACIGTGPEADCVMIW